MKKETPHAERLIRITFDSEQDTVKGIYELGTKGIVRGFKGNIFEIPEYCKEILDNAGVSYRILSDKEVSLYEVGTLRNFPTPYVQRRFSYRTRKVQTDP